MDLLKESQDKQYIKLIAVMNDHVGRESVCEEEVGNNGVAQYN